MLQEMWCETGVEMCCFLLFPPSTAPLHVCLPLFIFPPFLLIFTIFIFSLPQPLALVNVERSKLVKMFLKCFRCCCANDSQMAARFELVILDNGLGEQRASEIFEWIPM